MKLFNMSFVGPDLSLNHFFKSSALSYADFQVSKPSMSSSAGFLSVDPDSY